MSQTYSNHVGEKLESSKVADFGSKPRWPFRFSTKPVAPLTWPFPRIFPLLAHNSGERWIKPGRVFGGNLLGPLVRNDFSLITFPFERPETVKFAGAKNLEAPTLDKNETKFKLSLPPAYLDI
eukprot:g746.t1